jgi:hypothetical protein
MASGWPLSNSRMTCRGARSYSGCALAEKDTPEFYRQEAERIARLAMDARDPNLRLQMLEIAESFLKLAEHATATHLTVERLTGKQSA